MLLHARTQQRNVAKLSVNLYLKTETDQEKKKTPRCLKWWKRTKLLRRDVTTVKENVIWNGVCEKIENSNTCASPQGRGKCLPAAAQTSNLRRQAAPRGFGLPHRSLRWSDYAADLCVFPVNRKRNFTRWLLHEFVIYSFSFSVELSLYLFFFSVLL